MRKPRVKRPKEKRIPHGYDSGFESRLDKEVLDEKWVYVPTPAPKPIKYVIEHTYHTDFVRKEGRKTIYLEAKGRFWDHAEYSKYVWVKKVLKKNEELVFLFAEPGAAMPGAIRRKDGTKRSHKEWAEKEGFRWYSEYDLPKEWRKKCLK
tara:strand:- start:1170 stop:1619 length:450 start_codon:yes stop_codon:yes gene_type:complete